MKRLLFAGTGLLSFACSACTGLMPRDNVAQNAAPAPGTVVYERKPWQHGPSVASIPTFPPTTSGMLNPAAIHPPLTRPPAAFAPAPVDPNAFAVTPPLEENTIPPPPRREVAVRTTPDAPEVAPAPRSIEPRVIQKPDWPSFVSRASSPDSPRPARIRVIPPDEPIPSAEAIARERPQSAPLPAPAPIPAPVPMPMPEVAPKLLPQPLPRAVEPSMLPPVGNLVVPPLEEPPKREIVVDPPLSATPPVRANTTSVVANSPQTETILMRIIRAFQENRPQEAIDILNRVDPQNRELLIFLVPIIAELSERSSAAPSQEDLGSMADRLQDALAALRSKAPLKFETTCYASKIEGYGRYTKLDKGSFAPGSRTQLYLELKNLSWLPGTMPPAKNVAPQKGYLLHMVCQIEIQDASGRLIWQSEPMEKRDFRQTVPGDYHLTPSFGVPEALAVGSYKLAVKVTDKPTGRTARTTLDFLVSGERK